MELSLDVLYRSQIEKAPKVHSHNEKGENTVKPACQYGRLVKIMHSRNGMNGVVLSVFEQFGQPAEGEMECTRGRGTPVYASCDDGKSWKMISRVSDEEHPEYTTYWMPNLYELPIAMGDFPAGTLLLGNVTVDREEGSWLRLYVSTDSGNTWRALGNLEHGGWVEHGVWEPFFFIAADGRLVCCYCDERTAKAHSQKIVMRWTRDLVSWSMQTDIIAPGDPLLRPGMPVVTRLGDGSYFMVYEIVGIKGNPIYGRCSEDGLTWGDKGDIGTYLVSGDGKALGSSPYCLWVDTGSRGSLFVSGAFMSKGESTTGTDYLVSFDGGKHFDTLPHPVPYSQSDHTSHTGYSNSFLYDKEQNRFYAINNPASDGDTTAMTVAVCNVGNGR